MLVTHFAPPPLAADLTHQQRALVDATRRWVRARTVGTACPLAAATARLGSAEAAQALHLLLATVGAAWPDPVAVAPPCCARLTHDETTLVAMTVAALRHGRPVFDALLCEMLDADARERLFASALRVGAALGI